MVLQIQRGYATKRPWLAGGLIVAGLVVQLASLFWRYPLSFIALMLAGSMLSLWGTVIYLSGGFRNCSAWRKADDMDS